MPYAVSQASILTSTKKALNIPEEVTVFDTDIIMHINSAFSKLNQLGVGTSQGFSIEDSSSTWDEFIDDSRLNMVQSYVYLEVRLLFDPPTASLLTSMEKKRDELEWRLAVVAEDIREEVQFA